ncbi:hypothetical protein [Pseudomonas hygromyciniae]|uniref:hypothetical protein n=1 Tax=Pseudomonas hygromyciniae TaxID=2812000 RepID=UPI001F080F1A|nr:hypothetical protein [Pseudomonas hygromyciniae]
MSPLNHLPLCRSLLWISALFTALLALAPCAQAAVKIEGTRLIYFGQYKEASINIVNQSPQ